MCSAGRPPVGPVTEPASTENSPAAERNHRLDPQAEQKPRRPPPAVAYSFSTARRRQTRRLSSASKDAAKWPESLRHRLQWQAGIAPAGPGNSKAQGPQRQAQASLSGMAAAGGGGGPSGL